MRDITMAVYEFMVKENIQERLQRTEEEFQKAGELALAKEYSQVYRIIIELFDKFVELLGEEQVGLNEYCKLLDAGLEEARVGVIPPSVDQVVAGDMQRTRLKDIRALFFLGANDSFLPGALMRTRSVNGTGQREVPAGGSCAGGRRQGKSICPEVLPVYEPD